MWTGDPALSLPAQPLPILRIDALLLRLPAQARADLAWARKPIQDGVHRLRTEALTDELVREVATTLDAPFDAVRQALRRELSTNLDGYRATLMTELGADEHAIATFLEDDDARDTLAWVTGLFRSAFSATVAPGGADLSALSDEDWRRVAAQPALAPYKAALLTFMAAADEARTGADRERAGDLIDVAFLQMSAFSDAMRSEGLLLAAFPHDTTEQRGQRAIASAGRLRGALSADDWRTLDAARFTNLR